MHIYGTIITYGTAERVRRDVIKKRLNRRNERRSGKRKEIIWQIKELVVSCVFLKPTTSLLG